MSSTKNRHLLLAGIETGGGLSRGVGGFIWPRHIDGQQEARKEQEPRKEIRCAGKMEAEASRNGESKNLSEEDGASHSGNGAKRVDVRCQWLSRSESDDQEILCLRLVPVG